MEIKKISKSLILILIIPLLFFSSSYLHARTVAKKQMLIISVHDEETFQAVKNLLYDISSNERKKIWTYNHYPLIERAGLEYKITDIDCVEVKGFSHFIFNIDYELYNVLYENKYWDTLPMQCTIYIKDSKVYNMHRTN